jgi:hypothetical protein
MMNASGRGSFHQTDYWLRSSSEEKLDRALVAGMILEVILDTPKLPSNTQARQQLIKARLKSHLVHHLAGQVTLDRFRSLTRCLERWFGFYYPLFSVDHGSIRGNYLVQEPALKYKIEISKTTPGPPARKVFWDDRLDRWLESLRPSLPRRSHRKLSLEKLREFLHQTAGGWFRLRQFGRFFQIDRKTAWDYLQQFLGAGLICHNQKKSAAVRYCLNPQLLKVKADNLRQTLSQVLADFPETAVDQLGDRLIATGGEPFRGEEWERQFPPEQLESLLTELLACDIVALQILPSGARLLRLHSRWRQPHSEAELASC